MDRQWKNIIEYEGYQVSNYGEIKSLERKDNLGRKVKSKIRKLVKDTRGYYQVGLYSQRRLYLELVHRIVAKYFINNTDNKPCVNHKNGIKSDNCIDNLEWCTYSENNKHACRNGLMAGEKNFTAKLTEDDVREIRKIYNNNRFELAKKYGVDESTIRNIIKMKTWIYVK